jgi:hypothetical protein
VDQHLQHGDQVGGCNVVAFRDGSSLGAQSANVSDETAAGDIQLYPNPVQDRLNINLGKTANQTRQVNIVDISGRIVSRTPVKGQSTLVVPTNFLSPGIYFVQLIGEKVKSYKILKQ